MRNKKLLITVFSLFVFFFLSINVQAKKQPFYCTYSVSDKNITVKFRVRFGRGGKTSAESATLSGLDVRTNFKYKNNSESVKNWSSPYFSNLSFNGVDYYEANTKCPPKVLVSLSDSGYNVFVTDDSSIDALKTAMKNHYPSLTDDNIYTISSSSQEPEVEDVYETPSCIVLNDKNSCENDKYFSCVWVESDYGGYCNVDKLQYVKCGGAFDIPVQAPAIISFVINFFKIAAPILLVLVSVVTLVKALASSVEDEIVKARKKLIKKMIYAALIFFVIQIVQFVVIRAADSSEEGNITSCLSCFLNNSCSNSIYYKTNVGGIDICTYLTGVEVDNENGNADGVCNSYIPSYTTSDGSSQGSNSTTTSESQSGTSHPGTW